MEKRVGIKTLVDLIVASAEMDRTVPASNNLRTGWGTDSLFQAIDGLVINYYNDPAMYKEIGREVFARASGLPETAALAMLAILRGELFLPVKSEREQRIYLIINDTGRFIDDLPDGPRKARCRSLFNYHRGYFYEQYGHFRLAADMHRQAAREAPDSATAAISYFMQRFCQLKEALLAGESEENIEISFFKLRTMFALLIERVRGSPFEVQWANYNAPYFMVRACVWLNKDHLDWDQWLETAIKTGSKMGRSNDPGVEFLLAMSAVKRNDPGAESMLKAVYTGACIDEDKATAFLVLARLALRAGFPGNASDVAEMISFPGTREIRALAEREIRPYVKNLQ